MERETETKRERERERERERGIVLAMSFQTNFTHFLCVDLNLKFRIIVFDAAAAAAL